MINERGCTDFGINLYSLEQLHTNVLLFNVVSDAAIEIQFKKESQLYFIDFCTTHHSFMVDPESLSRYDSVLNHKLSLSIS